MDYSSYIGARDGKKYLLNKSGDTSDIIAAILSADQQAGNYSRNLAPVLRRATARDTCKAIWDFWRAQVRYKEDPDGYQFVKSPRELYHSAEGDCKSFSIAVASCLKNLGIPYAYRFTSETAGKDFHHVYIVALPKGEKPIIVDCVLSQFDYQNPFVNKKDIVPASAMPKIGRIGAGEQQITDIENSWQLYVETYKKQAPIYVQNTLAAFAKDIKEKFSGTPVKRKLILDAAVKKWPEFLNVASVLVYHYWPAAYGPFPTELAPKKKYGGDLHLELSKLGLTDSTMRDMCSLSCFNLYGIPLDYLLYRAKCLVTYGLPWKPKAGYPYWDAKNMQLVPNGAPFGLAVQILAAMPFGGGISRPYGTPYWSRAGFIVPNGMKPEGAIFDKWLAQNPKPTYPPGTGVVSQQGVLDSIAQYELWRKGELPGLPTVFKVQTDINGQIIGQDLKSRIGVNGSKIGLAAAVIAAIVSASLTFVGGVIGGVMSILAQKAANEAANVGGGDIPNYPVDFNESSYTATDGCTVYLANGVYNKVCPNGQTQTNINPNAPENQPAPGAFALGGQSKALWLGIAAAGLILVSMFMGKSNRSNN
jgi:hypothetical protein